MEVLRDIMQLFVERWDFFLNLTLEHLYISLTAIFFAALIGLFLGIFISEHSFAAKSILNVVNFIYTIPAISLLGLLMLFSGIGNFTAVIALTIYALLPMVRSTYTGLTNINPAVIEAAKGMGSTDFQILYKIKLPLSLPIIIAALRNMSVMTIALAGIASFIGAGGLGVAIFRGITTNNPEMTAVGSLLIALLAFAFDALLGFVEKSVINRKEKSLKKLIFVFTATLLAVCLTATFLMDKQQENIVKIATKPMTEQYIMGEMLKILIEQDTALKVILTQGIGGGTSNIQPAMLKGEFDLYPEYTGTGWNAVLKKDGIYTEDLFPQLQKEYQQLYGLTWATSYGFNNTYGLAIKKALAERYEIKTYSDLNAFSSEMTFGAEADFYEREDGYKALCNVYGYDFKKTVDLDLALKYKAMQEGQIDAMNIFTTDGQLSVSDTAVLVDDKNFYPSYKCFNVVRMQTLQKYPQLLPVLQKLENTISDNEMAQMNYLVESEGKEPKAVAKEFLQKKKLLREGA